MVLDWRLTGFRLREETGFSMIELMTVIAIIGILAAIAIPSFMRIQARALSSEAVSNLKAVFTVQQAYMQEFNQYQNRLPILGFTPERGNLFAYYVGPNTAECIDRSGPADAYDGEDGPQCIEVDTFRYTTMLPSPAGAVNAVSVNWLGADGSNPADPGVDVGNCPLCNFSAYAVGNLDRDVACDIWIVASIAGEPESSCRREMDATLSSGIPFNLFDDVSCSPGDKGGTEDCGP